MSSVPLAFELDRSFDSNNLIWIPESDARGTVADPLFAGVAYENQAEFFRYRAKDFTDPADRATLLERAVFRASRAVKEAPPDDPRRYLFTTYAALVDETLSRAPRTPYTLDHPIPAHPMRNKEEERIHNEIYRREIMDAMPEEARRLWEGRLVGYSFKEMARQSNESEDTLNARARRGAKQALRRLFGQNDR
jgi:DNA-directed RNA polymerase specialized sigma24 family protein